MSDKLRLAVSVIVAPVSVPIFFFLINYLFSGQTAKTEDYVGQLLNETISAVLPLSYLFLLPSVVLGGLILRKLNYWSVLHVAASAVIMGAIVGGVFPWIIFERSNKNLSASTSLLFAAEFGLAALVASVTFCILYGVPIKSRNGKS